MIKTLTEQWKDGTLPSGEYYIKLDDGLFTTDKYFGKSGGFAEEIPVEVLTPVPSYDKYNQLVSKTDESAQKIHILNEQNTKQYNELCEEIKKNNILEKRLTIATKALKSFIPDDLSDGGFGEMYEDVIWDCKKALEEMEGVK